MTSFFFRNDANRADSASITLLTWAVGLGQEAAVELLLRREAFDTDEPDNTGMHHFRLPGLTGKSWWWNNPQTGKS